jgi:membrane protease YdiL (CAAX protease family)
MTHLAMQLVGGRTIHVELLLAHATLIMALALAAACRTSGLLRAMHVVLGALVVGSALTPMVTHDQVLQTTGRVVCLGILLSYSLWWTTRPFRGGLHDGLNAIQFGVGLFVAQQQGVFGVGDVMLSASPDLARQSWPLSVFGELVQEAGLLLLVGMSWLAAPRLIDRPGLRVPGLHWREWKPILIAALQVECGVILIVLLESAAAGWLHIDATTIGNAVSPAPGDWHPGPLSAVLLLAVLPGVVEELAFRGVIFQVMRQYVPMPMAVAISSGLFAFGHLGSNMAPSQLVSVFLFTFVAGSLAAIAYWRTGSLYAAMLAHIFTNAGPALAVVFPPESMSWVFFLTVELSLLGTLPLLFAVTRALRQRRAVSLTQ